MADKFITERGIAKLKSEHDELIKERPHVAVRLKEAAMLGDLSENAEYIEAKEYQAFVEGRILEIESVLRDALIVRPVRRKKFERVEVGCSVELAIGDQKRKYTIVGMREADPSKFEISSDSPIGMAVLGRSLGDIINVSTPSGGKKYKITRVA